MNKTIQKSFRTLAVFTVLTGLVYPLAVTGLAQLLMPRLANGSIALHNGLVVGSVLLEQKFSKPEYFWGRPSASDYGTMPSGASNFGPTSQKLKDRVTASMKDLGIDPHSDDKPYDLLLSSGSGLDPDLSPAGALFQMERIAKNRGLTIEQVKQLVDENTRDSFLGLIGRPAVNVLQLNLALDELKR